MGRGAVEACRAQAADAVAAHTAKQISHGPAGVADIGRLR